VGEERSGFMLFGTLNLGGTVRLSGPFCRTESNPTLTPELDDWGVDKKEWGEKSVSPARRHSRKDDRGANFWGVLHGDKRDGKLFEKSGGGPWGTWIGADWTKMAQYLVYNLRERSEHPETP